MLLIGCQQVLWVQDGFPTDWYTAQVEDWITRIVGADAPRLVHVVAFEGEAERQPIDLLASRELPPDPELLRFCWRFRSDGASEGVNGDAEEREAEERVGARVRPSSGQKRTADGTQEGPPLLVLAHGRAQAGLQTLCELAESVPLLRRQIVSTTSRRGVHDSEQTCVNSDLAKLIGVTEKGWYVLLEKMRQGRLPAKLLRCDKTGWDDSTEVAQRLLAVRYWVNQGLVELDMLHEKLARPLTASREGERAKKQALCLPNVRSASDRDASSTLCGAPTTPRTPVALPVLNWRHEEEELKRAVMVSAPVLACVSLVHLA